MKKILLFWCQQFQLFILKLSYALHKNSSNKKEWIVAGAETASMLQNLAKALPSSTCVNFAPNKFYSFSYDITFYASNLIKQLWLIWYIPFVFGRLLRQHKGVIYLGASGFITSARDGRATEFSYLKSLEKKVICYFVGSEIRSFKLLSEYAKAHELDVITTYQSFSNPGIDSPANENARKLLGEAANQYADHIFNPSVDQMAYIDRYTHPSLYFLPDTMFNKNAEKFSDINEIIICHGPSSPLIKGTPLVRAAIKKLKTEGYNFKYVELINIPHSDLLKQLKQAHIVLNEFYAFVPGIFAAEAMANHCAVLTSADPVIEPSVGTDFDDAWIVTPYWQIYDKLKMLLENPELIEVYASKGFDWACRSYHHEKAASRFRRLVN